MTTGPGELRAALEPTMRRRVLAVVSEAIEPLDAWSIAELLELHITTARFHLDQLESVGLVRRQGSQTVGRGRPRILYRAVGSTRDDSAREQLIDILATTIADDESKERVTAAAGHRWADVLAAPDVGHGSRELVRVLDQLGFEPQQVGESIELLGCPFRQAAREHPDVACSVHRALIDRVLARTGDGITAQLVPFVQPEKCLVTLTR